MPQHVEIFTDGACRGNPGPGGWGVLLRYRNGTRNTEKTLRGAAAETTNNRMELTAVIEALVALKQPVRVTLTTDSKYVLGGITEWLDGWKRNNWKTAAKKAVKNADLWRRLDDLRMRHTIDWRWVKGHSGHDDNERVDRLANQAIDEMLQGLTPEDL